ncbi:MAG: translation initiation factor IF-2 N-terminal domain-containing protein, partial [candidate division NC10 bacterium]
MRVYELAKKLGMENRELIPELKRIGVAVASHSSALDEATVQQVLDKLTPKSESARKGPGKREGAGAVSGQGEELTKPAKSGKGPGVSQESGSAGREVLKTQKSGSGVAVEPPKPEKRRILIKRKKTEEEEAAEALATPGLLPSEGVQIPSGPMPTVPEPAKAPVVPEPAPGESPLPGLPGGPPSAPVVHAGPADAPSAPAQAPAPLGPRPLLDPKRRGGGLEPMVGEATALKDKLKKTKKQGWTKDDEELKFREDAARWQDLRAIPVHRREDRSRRSQPSSVAEITKPRKKVIKLTAGVTVKEFAELVGRRPVEIMRQLMDTGQMRTLNQAMDSEAAVLIAEALGLKVEVPAEKQGEALLEEVIQSTEGETLLP